MCKNRHVGEKGYVWKSSTCNYESEKYLASIIDNLATVPNEVVGKKSVRTIKQILMKRKQLVKHKISISY